MKPLDDKTRIRILLLVLWVNTAGTLWGLYVTRKLHELFEVSQAVLDTAQFEHKLFMRLTELAPEAAEQLGREFAFELVLLGQDLDINVRKLERQARLRRLLPRKKIMVYNEAKEVKSDG